MNLPASATIPAAQVPPEQQRWICAQIGSRQNYFVPRALDHVGALELLITDAWFPPDSVAARHNKRSRGRFNNALAQADVHAPNLRTLAFEATSRIVKRPPIDRILARNRLFQRAAVNRLMRVPGDDQRTLISFSYASRDLFRYARTRGWHTVLDQIDPGPFEERLVQKLGHKSAIPPFPAEYWENWREECELSDTIVVNSIWTRDAIVDEGIAPDKIHIIPLAYDGPHYRYDDKVYPDTFRDARPMRVLFLGQIIPRKGILPLFEAIRRLAGQPIHFDFVGRVEIDIPPDISDNPMVTFHGSVPHSEAYNFYLHSDIFILPTYSDGFAVTQVEARALKLPVIASRFCGEVVEDGVNGLVLDAVSAEAMVAALQRCVEHPAMLQRMSGHDDRFLDIDAVGRAWTGLPAAG